MTTTPNDPQIDVFEFLNRLRQHDVEIIAEGERLRFSAPKGALTPELRSELARRKSEILALLHTAGDRGSVPLERVSRTGELPLSFSQLRLWFLEQFEPGTIAFHMPEAVRLTGPLDVAALRRSLHGIVSRHESLRTTFVAVAGRPVQVIAPEPRIGVPVVDLRRLKPQAREPTAERLAAAASKQPYDLERGPLMRTVLLQLDEAEHIFLLNIHHIVFDRWSMAVFLEEMTALYRAFTAGRDAWTGPSPLPEPEIQYADFAAWQRRWLRGEVLESLRSYWRQQLEGTPGVLRLPTDRPRPPVRTENGARRRVILPPPLTAALKKLCSAHQSTLFMSLLAAFNVLLWRYTSQCDLNVGTVIANRTRPELEKLIGFLLNTLVLRTDLGGDPGFDELLARVREVAFGAYGHQELPFEQLLDDLQPERALSYSPLFQVMLVFQNTPTPPLELAGLEVVRLEYESVVAANSDWGLWLWEQAGGIIGGFVEYNTDLYDTVTLLRVTDQFRTLLEAAVAHPGRLISQLPVLSPAARHQLFAEWNDVGAPPPEPTSVHQLFEAWAERLPEAIALVSEEGRLSYRELNARANRLGRRLRRLGVGPEVCVGIFLEYSPEVVVAALAVMKSGGVYLPLDALHARRRVGELVEGAGARVLLTRESLRSELPAELGANVVCLDSDRDEIARESAGNLPRAARGPNLVYLVYTSGTTGRPKAVMISHAALMNIFHGYQLCYDLDPDMVHLQMASFSFDVFTGDLLRALGAGGKLVMCPREVLLAPKDLYALIRRERVNCAEFVPAVVRELMSYLDRTGKTLAFMRLVIVGSDLWYLPEHETLKRWCGPGTRVFNTYGVAEATIDNTYFEYAAVTLADEGSTPIGRPFGSNRIYVLDRGMRPVPIGGVGELCVGGSTLARGYLGRPAMTAERFVPDPFRPTGRGGGRLYRTGDLARYLADGTMQFLGRVDNQIKLRGFRIEPGEIEAVLGEHPGVTQGVVIAREDIPGDRYLAAYFVSGGDPPPTASELRRFLKQGLPDYMVPAAFVHLDELPLNDNNKVDRRRLPAPSRTRPEPEGELRLPETPIEEDLADIFAEVVGVDEVGRDHDFFDLGGHSLLVTQAISRIRETFEIELPLRSFFEAPTVAELALVIEKELIAMVKGLDADELEALQ